MGPMLVGKFQVSGLSAREVLDSRRMHGANSLPPAVVESFWEKLRENFKDPLIKILMLALAITVCLAIFGFADWTEGLGIALSVFIATFVSTYSEHKNEASFQQLQTQASKIQCTVFRNAQLLPIEIQEVVVDDQVFLGPGDRIPADGYLVRGALKANQSSLNGENESCSKTARQKGAAAGDLDDFLDAHRCFRGAVVEEGEGVMCVDSVGVATVHGRLALELSVSDDREAPLQVKLADLANGVAKLGYFGAMLIAGSFMFKQTVMDNHYSLTLIWAYLQNWPVALHDLVTSLILAIIVIVCAVPEGLPMMIALVLSMNMRKLLASQVLVRRLMGIETAGSLEVLFADKTGTITEGVFKPELFLSGSQRSYPKFRDIPSALGGLLALALRGCASSVVANEGADGKLTLVGGNSTDRALLTFLPEHESTLRFGLTYEREILFNSAHKFAAAQVSINTEILMQDLALPAHMLQQLSFAPPSSSRSGGNPSSERRRHVSLIKGAPEVLLGNCSHYVSDQGEAVDMEDRVRTQLREAIDVASGRGSRVLAVAVLPRALPMVDTNAAVEVPRDLVLVGFIAVADKLRPTSKAAIKLAGQAGVQVVMVTGDRLETAVSIAKSVGLLRPEEETTAVITSTDLREMSDETLAARIPTLKVVARALPSDKSRLVAAAQRTGRVVGMTGDGVNDSAALKRADVSFAMGSGSEVAKEAADIVILDDKFDSILQAVLYGRTIFKSIRKFVVYQSTINLASTLIVFGGPFLGFDFPLTLIQLLWLNLVMDTMAALAFGGSPALNKYLSSKPISREAPIINARMWGSIISNGLFMAVSSVVFLTSDSVLQLFDRPVESGHISGDLLEAKNENRSEIVAQGGSVFLTAFFSFFIFLCAFNAFNVRVDSLRLWEHFGQNHGFLITVPAIFLIQITFVELGGTFLRTVPLTGREWATLFALSAWIVPFDLLRKATVLRLGHRVERWLRIGRARGSDDKKHVV